MSVGTALEKEEKSDRWGGGGGREGRHTVWCSIMYQMTAVLKHYMIIKKQRKCGTKRCYTKS